MNPNKIKKNPTTEIKEKIKKSKFDVLTNENDFLVKNLSSGKIFYPATILLTPLPGKLANTYHNQKIPFVL